MSALNFRIAFKSLGGVLNELRELICIDFKKSPFTLACQCRSTLGRSGLWNSQRPYPTEHNGGSYKVRVGGVLVLAFDVESQVLHWENVGALSANGVHRIKGQRAGGDSQISRPNRYSTAVCGHLPLVVANKANLQ